MTHEIIHDLVKVTLGALMFAVLLGKIVYFVQAPIARGFMAVKTAVCDYLHSVKKAVPNSILEMSPTQAALCQSAIVQGKLKW